MNACGRDTTINRKSRPKSLIRIGWYYTTELAFNDENGYTYTCQYFSSPRPPEITQGTHAGFYGRQYCQTGH